MFKTLLSKVVYKNKWMKVFEDEIEYSNGKKGIYGYVKRSDGVDVAVVNEKNEILLIKQFRYPINSYQWSFPGGGIDGQDPEKAAVREVKEETGLEISNLEKLATVYPLSSCSMEKNYIYLARVEGVVLAEEDISDDDESIIEKKFVPISEALEMIDFGTIAEGDTCNIIQMVARKFGV